MKLKLDENLGHRWAETLRHAGHDVHTVHQEGLSGSSDATVLHASTTEGRALVTLDLDFANPIHYEPAHTTGIVVLRVNNRPGRRDLDIVVTRLVHTLEHRDPTGRLWIVDTDRVRQYEPPPS